MEFTEAQIEELVGVFKAESIEHIKALADIFLTLEEGRGNANELFDRAFREAHSLKGSAGTLGFQRVEALTHRLEDVLGILKRGEIETSVEVIDILLSALDTIRGSVENIRPGENELTEDEVEQTRHLEKLLQTARAGSTGPPASTSSSGMSELGSEQVQQLLAVFRAEAKEHIKNLAELLFNIEEGKGDPTELVSKAFREAHSLKGSAGTLGFGRVEDVTHHFEDILGLMNDGKEEITSEDIDLLLTVLDVVRKAVDTSVSGDKQLTDEEVQIIASLKKRTGELSEAETEGDNEQVLESSEKGQQAIPDTVESSGTIGTPIKQKPDQKAPRKSADDTEKNREDFIRISEAKLEAVIAQVSELFEANLQLESLTPELGRFSVMAVETLEMIEVLQVELENTIYENDLFTIADKVRNLSVHLSTTKKTFERDERQITKLIQGSQEELHRVRLAPVSTIFVMIRRQVREIAKATGKKAELYLGGGEYAVDRKVLEAIEEPLVHILRNAVDHGIESTEIRRSKGKTRVARLSIVARHTGDSVEIVVADDGKGVDPEIIRNSLMKKQGMTEAEANSLSTDQLLDCLFMAGFSTHIGVSKMSGRGVGLDVVKYTVERLGGEVRLESNLGEGTAITLRLPLAMSTIRCLLLKDSGRVLAIPASNVDKVIVPKSEDIKLLGGGEVITYQGENIPLGSLGEILGLKSGIAGSSKGERLVMMISFGDRRFAFTIDELLEYTQLILKPLGDLLERVANISGTSMLGTGEIALVLNPADLVRAAGGGVRLSTAKPIFPSEVEATDLVGRVLVVDDSIATRTLEKTLLESAGYTVLTASDGYKALDVLATNRCDVVISDVQMPNMDGIELTHTIKSRPQFSHLPVILITSLGSDEDKARGLAAGADAYIVKKELTQSELVETIGQLL